MNLHNQIEYSGHHINIYYDDDTDHEEQKESDDADPAYPRRS